MDMPKIRAAPENQKKNTMRSSVPQHPYREEFKRSGTEKRKR